MVLGLRRGGGVAGALVRARWSGSSLDFGLFLVERKRTKK